MNQWKVVVTDHGFTGVESEERIIGEAGGTLKIAQCKSPQEVLEAARGADALLVQWAPVTREVIESLDNCKIIVRYGIGIDNIDLEAAREKGIAVCNVPDYCIDEVADHTLALALAAARQLPQIDARLRAGTWKLTPDSPMPAFRDTVFATAGYGRIARAVLERARSFGFRLAAYDPYVPDEAMKDAEVLPVAREELFRRAGIVSLHLPLTEETRHFVNADVLRQMQPTAILVNTARGPLVDTVALAEALRNNEIAGAGIDVFEPEPLTEDHPLRRCDNAILTSHVAWYSESSIEKLQLLAAEEVVRGLKGEALRSQVNK